MFSKAVRAALVSVLALSGWLFAMVSPAAAVPIFAERYGYSCSACHTAVPDLNAFGNAFRRAGFVIPKAPRHTDFPLALRFSETYMKDLQPSQTRRFNALAILISTENFGSDRSYSYFARYLFGSQGAAGSLFYAWAQHVDPKTGNFARLGLFSLPLIESPTQRLDTITSQPVYTYTVGHSSANLATPRLGLLFGQRNEHIDAEVAVSGGEYHGAAYGAPAPPSDFEQTFNRPEVFGQAIVTLGSGFRAGVVGLNGERHFRSRASGGMFNDVYYRDGVQGEWSRGRFDAVAQQVWGHDSNSDGFLTAAGSSGGFVSLKYRPTLHSYLGVRYDAAANPIASRDFDFFGVFAPTVHSRFVVEYLRPIGRPGAQSVTSAQLLFALPFADPHTK